MANVNKSFDALVAEVSAAVRKEVTENLKSVIGKISAAVAELESHIHAPSGRGGAGKKRRGRPVGSGKKAAPKARRSGGKRSPRGALQAAVRSVLQEAKKPVKLSHIRDGVLKHATFKGRDPKTLYTMIVFAVKKMPEVTKNAAGLYGLGGRGASAPAKGRKKAGG